MAINLNELTLENIGQWPKPAKIGAVIFLVIFLIGLGYWFIAKPNFDEYDSLNQQEVSLKSEFERKQSQASNLTAYRNQLNMMQELFGDMLKQLPTENEMPGLLEDISKTGVASGLTFELFAPMTEIPHDFYIEAPIKIAVMGTYHQFATFISRIVQMSRIVTLHDLTIESEEQKKQKENPGSRVSENVNPGDKLTMKITAKIYRYRTR